MKSVEFLIDWEEMVGVACSEAVGELGKGKAGSEQGKLGLGIIYAGMMVKDFSYLLDSLTNCITGERNISYWGPKEIVTGGGSLRYSTGEWVGAVYVWRQDFSAPN